MRSKSAVGLLLGAWLLWMLLTAPARLLTAALPAGIGVYLLLAAASQLLQAKKGGKA